jgi:hypothetical protein
LVVEQNRTRRTAHLLGQTPPSRWTALVVTAGGPTSTTLRATGDPRTALVGWRLPTAGLREGAGSPLAAALGGRGVAAIATRFGAGTATDIRRGSGIALGRGTAGGATADLAQGTADGAAADPPKRAAELRLGLVGGDRGHDRAPAEPEQSFQQRAPAATGREPFGESDCEQDRERI